MTARLNSPGSTAFESKGEVSFIKGSNTGIAYMIGIAEFGEVGKVYECISYPDFEKKFGGYISGYYLNKCANAFFKNGGYKLYVVRTAHYAAGVLSALKSSLTVKGFNDNEEDRAKVDTLKFEATGEGLLGNKINVSNKKAETELDGLLAASAITSAILDEIPEGLIAGDIVDISDGSHYVRVIVTNINTATKTIYFKSVTLASIIADAAVVNTASTHAARTVLLEDLVTDATSARLSNVSGINIGSILTFIDTQSGSPNSVSVKVTDISNNVVSFATVGTITTILIANSLVVSQEFDITVYFQEDQERKTITYLSMVAENEVNYIENKMKSDLITVEDLDSSERDIGDFPEVFDLEYLTGGDDGLTSLADTDFSGVQADKTGLYAFDILPRQFAQIGSPDCRTASFQSNLNEYALSRGLWTEFDFSFDLTWEEAKEHVTETAMLNTNMGEINYPNPMWKNPITGIIEVIPQCGHTMGLNARVWSEIGKGPWIAAAGTEDGKYKASEGFETDVTEDKTVRDALYEARINALYRYPSYGDLKYGIQTLESDGEFPQVPERVVFLYCEHSIVNGTPWIVFKNIDTSSLKRLSKTAKKFLRGVWRAGGLKGLKEEDAFVVDVGEDVNTTEREEAGEMWCKIGLATKKAGEFVYFEFHKKIA